MIRSVFSVFSVAIPIRAAFRGHWVSALSLTMGSLYQGVAWAHHTKDHLMLQQDVEQVIATTREGGRAWLAWLVLMLLLVLGLVRWWKGRS